MSRGLCTLVRLNQYVDLMTIYSRLVYRLVRQAHRELSPPSLSGYSGESVQVLLFSGVYIIHINCTHNEVCATIGISYFGQTSPLIPYQEVPLWLLRRPYQSPWWSVLTRHTPYTLTIRE